MMSLTQNFIKGGNMTNLKRPLKKRIIAKIIFVSALFIISCIFYYSKNSLLATWNMQVSRICENSGQYSKAIFYLKRSLVYQEKLAIKNPQNESIIFLANLSKLHLAMLHVKFNNNYHEAMSLIEEVKENNGCDNMVRCDEYIALIYYKMGNKDRAYDILRHSTYKPRFDDRKSADMFFCLNEYKIFRNRKKLSDNELVNKCKSETGWK